MAKKWLVILLAVVASAFTLTACGLFTDVVEGTYQMEYNGTCTSSCYFELDGKGKVTYFEGKDLWDGDEDFSASGEYTLEGTKITITITVEGITDSVSGTVKGRVLDLGEMGKFYKNGKIPSSTDNDNGDNGDNGDNNVNHGADGVYELWSDDEKTIYAMYLNGGKGVYGWHGTYTLSGENITMTCLDYVWENNYDELVERTIIGTVKNGVLRIRFEEDGEEWVLYKEGLTPSQSGNGNNSQTVDGIYYRYDEDGEIRYDLLLCLMTVNFIMETM